MPVTGGGRSSRGPTPVLSEWACPSCGEKQQGRIEDGCVHCGAGKPGQRIEQAPASSSNPVEAAFTQWLGPLRGTVDAQTEQLMFAAFQAGYQLASTLQSGPIKPRPPEAPLSGTPKSRTLAAALRLFIDQVLQFGPDEVESGEFLSATEAERLITQIEGDQT